MKFPLFVLTCGVMMARAAIGLGQPAAQISNRHSWRQEVRKPDVTISAESSKPVSAIACNSDGRFLAVADGEKIRVYEMRSGGRFKANSTPALNGHSGEVVAMGFNEANTLTSLGRGGGVKVWDIASGKMVRSTQLNFENGMVAAFAPGEKPWLAGAVSNNVVLWNYQTGETITNFVTNDSGVAAMAFTPDGRSLVIGTWKGVVRVMDVATWKVARIIDLDSPIHSLAAMTNRILLGYGDGTVAMLKFEEQPSIPTVKKQTGAINAVAFSADGKRFASASADGTVKVWDAERMELLWSLEGHGGAMLLVAFRPDGREVVAGDAKGKVSFWVVSK